MENIEKYLSYIIPVFAILGIVNFIFIMFYRNAKIKKIAWPILMAISAGVFLGLIHFLKLPIYIFLILAVFLVISIIVNSKMIVFCQTCGRPLSRNMAKINDNYCEKCSK